MILRQVFIRVYRLEIQSVMLEFWPSIVNCRPISLLSGSISPLLPFPVWISILYNCINYLCTYDLYGPVHNVFDACRYITWASGKGLGPGNGKFLGPVKWHRAVRRVPFGAQKTRHKMSAWVSYSLTNTGTISMFYTKTRQQWSSILLDMHFKVYYKGPIKAEDGGIN